MANIAEFVKKIRGAVYGKDVRESIAAGIEAINDEAAEAKTSAAQSAKEAAAAHEVADTAAGNANTAAREANASKEAADEAAADANAAAQAAVEAALGAAQATGEASTARDAANTAAQAANTSKTAADTAAANANESAQAANTAAQTANTAASEANAAKENAQAQANHAKEQGDRAKTIVDTLEGTDVGGLATSLNAHLADKKNPHNITPAGIGAATTEELQKLKEAKPKLSDIDSSTTDVKDIPVADDYLPIIDSADNMKMKKAPAILLMEMLPPENHRTIFRGYDLGTEFTDEQLANIQNGTFKDHWLGDFWTIGGVPYRIIDINYFYNTNYEKKHHLVIMPDHALYSAKMNTSNTTADGYYGSDMYKNGLTNARTMINAAFNNHIWKHVEYLSNAVTNGIVTGCSSYSVDVAIPSETMMYGHTIYASPFNKDGVTDNLADMYPFDKSQFALFAAQPKFITDETNYDLLRDVVSSRYFAHVYYDGSAGYCVASSSGGVRPYVCVG